MAITVSGTAITFNDATTQTTAASPSSYAGAGGQVFTSSGTFTIPTGVTSLKVSVVGAGGGGDYLCGCTFYDGSVGGTSSVSSGTQTISTVSATGGSGGGGPGGLKAGGLGSGGDLNMSGMGPINTSSNFALVLSNLFGNQATNVGGTPRYGGGAAGFSSSGQGAAGGSAIKFLTGLTAGNTLTVTIGNGGGGNATGAKGVVVFEW